MRVVFGANLDLDPHDPGDLRRHNSQQERIAQIAAIRKVIGTSQESVVLTGDLNTRPDTPEIAAITEDLVDAWTAAGVGDGYTYPAENPHARLDYVLHSIDVVTCIAAVLSTDGSDHLPVAADLALPGDRMGAGSVGRPADGWSDRSTVEARMAAAEPSGEPP